MPELCVGHYLGSHHIDDAVLIRPRQRRIPLSASSVFYWVDGRKLLAVPRTLFFCISGEWLSFDGDHLHLEKLEASTCSLSHMSTALIARQDATRRRVICQGQASLGTTGLPSWRLSIAQGRCAEYLIISCWLFDKKRLFDVLLDSWTEIFEGPEGIS